MPDPEPIKFTAHDFLALICAVGVIVIITIGGLVMVDSMERDIAEYLSPVIEDARGNVTIDQYYENGEHVLQINYHYSGGTDTVPVAFKVYQAEPDHPMIPVVVNESGLLYNRTFYGGDINNSVRIVGKDSYGGFKIVMETDNFTRKNEWKFVNWMES